MEHEPEFSKPAKSAPVASRLASDYHATFTSDHGKRVLEDLKAKFGHDRPRFVYNPATGAEMPLSASAKIDGQCDVIREIEQAMSSAHKQGA